MPHQNQTLEQAFDFSAEELELNRSGRLSEKQRQRVKDILVVRKMGQRFALIGLGLPIVGMIGYLIYLAEQSQNAAARPYLLSVAGFLALMAVVFAIRGISARRTLTRGAIKSAEGKVKLWSKEIGRSGTALGTAYYLKVGRKKFQLESPTQFNGLKQKGSYRFFYVPNGPVPIILSVDLN